MNLYFAFAAILTLLVGVAHSVLGERMIFRHLRRGGLVPTEGGTLLSERQVRILWASWHVLTVFGWGMAAILVWLSLHPSGSGSTAPLEQAVAVSMLIGSLLVFVGTRAKHPGWVGLLGVAALVWFGR